MSSQSSTATTPRIRPASHHSPELSSPGEPHYHRQYPQKRQILPYQVSRRQLWLSCNNRKFQRCLSSGDPTAQLQLPPRLRARRESIRRYLRVKKVGTSKTNAATDSPGESSDGGDEDGCTPLSRYSTGGSRFRQHRHSLQLGSASQRHSNLRTSTIIRNSLRRRILDNPPSPSCPDTPSAGSDDSSAVSTPAAPSDTNFSFSGELPAPVSSPPLSSVAGGRRIVKIVVDRPPSLIFDSGQGLTLGKYAVTLEELEELYEVSIVCFVVAFVLRTPCCLGYMKR